MGEYATKYFNENHYIPISKIWVLWFRKLVRVTLFAVPPFFVKRGERRE